jgi:hypothetical protein
VHGSQVTKKGRTTNVGKEGVQLGPRRPQDCFHFALCHCSLLFSKWKGRWLQLERL